MKKFISTKSFEIIKSADPEVFVIAGYASTPSIDREGDSITLSAMKEAFSKFMQNVLFRNINLEHGNTQIGVVLDDYRDIDGKLWESKVDNNGMFIVAKLRNDIKKARVAQQKIKNRVLKAYSIAGEPIEFSHIQKDGMKIREIEKLELHEITICEVPMNQDAEFELLKSQQKSTWKHQSKDAKLIKRNGRYFWK